MAGATGYLVDEWINGTWTKIASAGSGSGSYAVKGLSASTTYFFEVGAFNAAGTTWANYRERRHDRTDTHSPCRSAVHDHAGFIVADQRGVDRSGRRDRLPGR